MIIRVYSTTPDKMLASNLCKLIDSTKPFKTFVNKAAIASADERAPAFKGPNNAALAASMLAYEPAPAFNSFTNCS